MTRTGTKVLQCMELGLKKWLLELSQKSSLILCTQMVNQNHLIQRIKIDPEYLLPSSDLCLYYSKYSFKDENKLNI